MSLPNPSMSFTPLDPLPASDLNDMVENIEALAAGTGLNDGVITEAKMANGFLHGSDGYIDATDTWTYASASSFTIAGVDRTAKFPKGTRIRLTQTTDKYFYVTSSSFSTNTTVNITGGSDYSLANAAITSPRYSYIDCPQGFPQWFASTVTINSGLTLGNGTAVSRFSISNGKMYFRGLITFGSTTSISTSPNIATPIAIAMSSAAYTTASTDIGLTTYYDQSTGSSYPSTVRFQSTTSLLLVVSNVAATYPVQNALSATVPFTWTTSDTIAWNMWAEMA